MNALRSSAFKADVRLECKLRFKFANLKAKGQLRSLYRNQYAKRVADQTVSTVQTVAGHSVLKSETYNPTPIRGKRVGVQADPQHDAQKLQRHTGIDLCGSAASEASPYGTTALDQSVTERKQLQEILDQVQRAREVID
uniref:Uncharacterized protein n=1 Tax=Hyaloperonospora arabidopsidis (strain Emoy2) TaxID=559515 RepID=M4B6N1_HYAAE